MATAIETTGLIPLRSRMDVYELITVDAEKKCIDLVDVTAEELTEHMKEWVAPPLKATRGTMYKFIKNVKSASEGCATDE
ncbi:hypothetical protein PInf_016009 [Phytophthora infestans]|nr:hypothetical protein PInf_016009 [Phytophthora infestans]